VKTSIRTVAVQAALCFLLPACVTSTQATRLQKDLDDVKRQVFQVQQDTAGSRAQIEEMSRRGGGGDGSAGQAEIQSAIRSVLDQIQGLTERMEELKSRMAALSQEIQSLKSAGPRSYNQVEGSGGAPASPVPQSSNGAAADAAGAAFKTAYSDYSKGNYELAVMGFNEFLRAYPSNPLCADAQYWIGECLYSQGKYKEAGEAMDRAVEKYPSSEKLPAALLKKGYAQIESGQTPMAVATLQRLIDGYPQTDEARLAADRLRLLGLRAR